MSDEQDPTVNPFIDQATAAHEAAQAQAARTNGTKVRALTDITNTEDGRVYRTGEALTMWRPVDEVRALQRMNLVEILDASASVGVQFLED